MRIELPYETQSDEWSCGAAALTMVYRSFGIASSQTGIWERIRSHGPGPRLHARAQDMVADAWGVGLHALLIEVRDPWLVLERSLQHSVRLIVNHCPDASSGIGHYSVVVGLDPESVTLHDPDGRPGRVLTRAEFLKLWNPTVRDREIPNQILIGIAETPSPLGLCPLCERISVDCMDCPGCRKVIPLQPLPILGCTSDGCPMRSWEQVFCPFCTHTRRTGILGSKE